MKISIFILLSLMLSCTSTQALTDRIVLVHGAHFSGDSFDELVKELHPLDARVVNLPNDVESAKKITLQKYAEHTCQFLKQFQDKSVLLGHSQGGAVINQALSICPEKIKALAYIAATIPFPGEMPFQLFGAQDDEFYFKAISENKKSGLFEISDMKAFIEAFAHDGDSSEKNMVEKLARPEPIGPSGNVLNFELKKLQGLSKLVVLTSKDRVISLQTQKAYSGRLEKVNILSIDSGHLAMLTQKEVLAKMIKDFSKGL